ncbi:MAG: hypothetical protein GEV08_24785 [Acidimicrobiia bacterium]|nr:hypothetical protein [Acidimicrobiia bacterium]
MTTTVTATPDPPPTGIPNPIHDEAGATGAGYQGALVAGVRTWGWVADAVAAVAGEAWRDAGWADFTLRRPLFAGEELTIEVAPAGGGWALRAAVLEEGPGSGGRVVLDGEAGLGHAPWLGELGPPAPAPALGPPATRPTYTVDTAPVGEPLRPLGAFVTAAAARAIATTELGLEASALPEGRVHPWFLSARMAPLTRHNFTYGPTIHVRTQVQHRGPALADRQIVVGARIVDTYERKGHWYQVLDGVVTDETGTELARLRHHTIFRPRGTELPPPITAPA